MREWKRSFLNRYSKTNLQKDKHKKHSAARFLLRWKAFVTSLWKRLLALASSTKPILIEKKVTNSTLYYYAGPTGNLSVTYDLLFLYMFTFYYCHYYIGLTCRFCCMCKSVLSRIINNRARKRPDINDDIKKC